jgi:hypothetical protein
LNGIFDSRQLGLTGRVFLTAAFSLQLQFAHLGAAAGADFSAVVHPASATAATADAKRVFFIVAKPSF